MFTSLWDPEVGIGIEEDLDIDLPAHLLVSEELATLNDDDVSGLPGFVLEGFISLSKNLLGKKCSYQILLDLFLHVPNPPHSPLLIHQRSYDVLKIRSRGMLGRVHWVPSSPCTRAWTGTPWESFTISSVASSYPSALWQGRCKNRSRRNQGYKLKLTKFKISTVIPSFLRVSVISQTA